MAIDQDTLNTLKRIEKILKAQSATAPTGGQKAKIAGAKKNATDDSNKGDTKTYKATAKAFEGVTEAANGLNKSFVGLNKTVLMTRANFVAMNRQMRSQARQRMPQASSLISPAMPALQATQPARASAAASAQQRQQQATNAQALAATTQSLGRMRTGIMLSSGALLDLAKAAKAATNDAFFFASRGLNMTAGFDGLYLSAIKAGMGVREYTQTLSDSMPAALRANSIADFSKSIETANKSLARYGVFGEEASKLSASLLTTSTTLGINQSRMEGAVNGQIDVFNTLRKTTLMTAEQFRSLTMDLSENADVQGNLMGLAQSERAGRLQQLILTQTLGERLGASAKASKALGDALIAQQAGNLETRFQGAGLLRQASAMFGISGADAERVAQLNLKRNRTADENQEYVALVGDINAALQRGLNSGNRNLEFMAEQVQASLSGTGQLGEVLKGAGSVRLAQESGEIKSREEFGNSVGAFAQAVGTFAGYANGFAKSPVAMNLGTALVGGLTTAFAIFGFKGVGKAIGGIWNTLKALPTTIKNAFTGALSIAQKVPGAIGGALKGAGSAVAGLASGGWNMLKSGGSAVASGISSLWNTISRPLTLMPKIGSAFSAVTNTLSGAFNTVSNFFSSVVSKAGSMISSVGKLVPAMTKMLRSIPLVGSVIGAMIDGVGEAISGNIDAAFGGEGSWISRIGNTVYGVVTGALGGFADLIDGAAKFLGGEGWNLRNYFDQFTTLLRGGLMTSLSSIAKLVTFGSDNKLSRYFEEAADSSYAALDQLQSDRTATINSLGQEANKRAEETKKTQQANVDASKKAADAARYQGQVISSTQGLAAGAVTTARSIAQQAVPNQQIINQVKTPEEKKAENAVNNPQQTQQTEKLAEVLGNTATSSNETVAALLQQIVDLLREGNSSTESQSQALNALTRMAGRGEAPDNLVLLNRLTGSA